MGIDSINGIICDLNGEHYRMKEWGLAQSRLFNGTSLIPELWHPAENIGDVGASSAIVFSAIAAAAINNRYFGGPNLLLWTSSDMGGRGCLLLTSMSA
jgi:3-oxoacyl-[acyl-carrier-protein] synthase-1